MSVSPVPSLAAVTAAQGSLEAWLAAELRAIARGRHKRLNMSVLVSGPALLDEPFPRTYFLFL